MAYIKKLFKQLPETIPLFQVRVMYAFVDLLIRGKALLRCFTTGPGAQSATVIFGIRIMETLFVESLDIFDPGTYVVKRLLYF